MTLLYTINRPQPPGYTRPGTPHICRTKLPNVQMWPKCGSHPFSLGHVWANTERSTITHCLGSFLLPPPFSHLSAVSMLKCFVTIMSSPLWRMGPLWSPPFKKQLWDQTALLWLQWSWVMVVIKLRWTAAGFSLSGKPLTLDSSYSAIRAKGPQPGLYIIFSSLYHIIEVWNTISHIANNGVTAEGKKIWPPPRSGSFLFLFACCFGGSLN